MADDSIGDVIEDAIKDILDKIDVNPAKDKPGKMILYGNLNNQQAALFPVLYALSESAFKDSIFLKPFLDNSLYATWGKKGRAVENFIKIGEALIQKEAHEQSLKKRAFEMANKMKGRDDKNGGGYGG